MGHCYTPNDSRSWLVSYLLARMMGRSSVIFLSPDVGPRLYSYLLMLECFLGSILVDYFPNGVSSFILGFRLTLSINFGISISFHQELQMFARSSILLLRLGEGTIPLSSVTCRSITLSCHVH